MSRIGKLPIKILPQVKVNLEGEKIIVSGVKGRLECSLPAQIKVVKRDEELVVERKDNSRQSRALHGLIRALLANMVKGVNGGFRKELELSGVGYRAALDEKGLNLTIGFSHPVKFPAPPGITFTVSENKIIVEGADKQLVGEVASQIRSSKPPEPYKGKGIKYVGERIRRKVGKAVKTVGGAVK